MSRDSALALMIRQEHQRTLDLLNALDQSVRGRASRRPLDLRQAGERALLDRMIEGIDDEILRHFAVEEALVFPMVQESVGLDVVLMLIREHEAIGSLASCLLAAARRAPDRPLDESEWRAFRDAAEAFIDQETFHIQKEEAAVVGGLATLLTGEQDRAAAGRYRALCGLPAEDEDAG